ncbi:MAG: acyl-CoA dehydrogenase family protein [Dehalococcoidia bacterium]|nr:acyl-CoA dehydrogenase family protein [Dehalococcoidia bacterium]MCB9484463.1 acyl-CoA dehydrogenase family protein [Thermoflexaceae bacterium]
MRETVAGSSGEKVTTYLDRVASMALLVREFADQADRECRPAREVVEAASERGLFRLMMPPGMGGGGLARDEIPPILEAMARIDGSTGWMLAISQSRVSGQLSEQEYEALYANPDARLAGSLNPFRVKAVPVEGGFLFSGIAPYVSGCTYATWLSTLAVWVDGDQRKGVTGILPMDQCRVLETWNVVGLRGTGSHDVQFENVFVPHRRIAAGGDALGDLADSLTPVALGVAQHALDAFAELAQGKVATTTRSTLRERPVAQAQYGEATGSLHAARAVYLQSVANARRIRESGTPPTLREKAEMRLGAVTAAQLAARAVDLVFDASGLSGPSTSFDFERCWRDIHTMRQHVLLATPRYELVGRILLGLEPNSPII